MPHAILIISKINVYRNNSNSFPDAIDQEAIYAQGDTHCQNCLSGSFVQKITQAFFNTSYEWWSIDETQLYN